MTMAVTGGRASASARNLSPDTPRRPAPHRRRCALPAAAVVVVSLSVRFALDVPPLPMATSSLALRTRHRKPSQGLLAQPPAASSRTAFSSGNGAGSRIGSRSGSESGRRERTVHGYLHPAPPFRPIVHASHECTLDGNATFRLAVAVPHLVLIGAQKSGTSSLGKIFGDHPAMLRFGGEESHFFDNVRATKATAPRQLCQLRKAYLDRALSPQYQPSLRFDETNIERNVTVVFDKTPVYMLYPDIADAIDAVCPWGPRILAVLRNPVDRAWSHFAMEAHDAQRGEDSVQHFVARVDRQVAQLVEGGILHEALSVEAYLNSNSISSPIRHRDNLTLTECARLVRHAKEDSVTDRRYNQVFRGLYAPLLLPWVQRYGRGDRIMVVRFEELYADTANGTVLDEILAFAGVHAAVAARPVGEAGRRAGKPPDAPLVTVAQGGRAAKQMTTGRRRSRRRLLARVRHGQHGDLPPGVRRYLEHLYSPFNGMLAELLGEEWRGVWDV